MPKGCKRVDGPARGRSSGPGAMEVNVASPPSMPPVPAPNSSTLRPLRLGGKVNVAVGRYTSIPSASSSKECVQLPLGNAVVMPCMLPPVYTLTSETRYHAAQAFIAAHGGRPGRPVPRLVEQGAIRARDKHIEAIRRPGRGAW